MKITKLEHSGCIVEKHGQKIVFDPVEFAAPLPELDSVVSIIITHNHSDHFQPEVISKILSRNPSAQVFTTADTASKLPGSKIVKNSDVRIVNDFKLRFFGENHASILPEKIPCQNIGVVIDEQIVNPGDSFDLPNNLLNPKVLLVPSAAPWCKVPEGMEYIKALRPRIAIPIHNAILSKLGNDINNNWLRTAGDEIGTKLIPLEINESIEL